VSERLRKLIAEHPRMATGVVIGAAVLLFAVAGVLAIAVFSAPASTGQLDSSPTPLPSIGEPSPTASEAASSPTPTEAAPTAAPTLQPRTEFPRVTPGDGPPLPRRGASSWSTG
jgi:hypothetical protein